MLNPGAVLCPEITITSDVNKEDVVTAVVLYAMVIGDIGVAVPIPTYPANVLVGPPTCKLPPIPTPPTTCRAPVVVEIDDAVDVCTTTPVSGLIVKLLVV